MEIQIYTKSNNVCLITSSQCPTTQSKTPLSCPDPHLPETHPRPVSSLPQLSIIAHQRLLHQPIQHQRIAILNLSHALRTARLSTPPPLKKLSMPYHNSATRPHQRTHPSARNRPHPISHPSPAPTPLSSRARRPLPRTKSLTSSRSRISARGTAGTPRLIITTGLPVSRTPRVSAPPLVRLRSPPHPPRLIPLRFLRP